MKPEELFAEYGPDIKVPNWKRNTDKDCTFHMWDNWELLDSSATIKRDTTRASASSKVKTTPDPKLKAAKRTKGGEPNEKPTTDTIAIGKVIGDFKLLVADMGQNAESLRT